MKIGVYHVFSLLFVFAALGVGAYTYSTAGNLQQEVAQNVQQKKALESEIVRLRAVRDGLSAGHETAPLETVIPTAASTEAPTTKQCPPAGDGEELALLRKKVADLNAGKETYETEGEAKFRELWRKFQACEEQGRVKDQRIKRLEREVARLSQENTNLKRPPIK